MRIFPLPRDDRTNGWAALLPDLAPRAVFLALSRLIMP